eukprot:CAMPEP_0113470666 /NCGR_PEP_ID=MMETSP0014_2-20120614/16565_1 /TAXON_ID=2857 /ORGANISM="Nitzschia sp." /LENGTH=1084 /DNA_ID=CAMNT_0000363247 /DNA_START=134 /DNA_END=3385 /DNA_ORIENTATION=+ /assembly_acc=CAM_ASM_000159
MPSDQELVAAAEEFKQKGNDAFQSSDPDDAIKAYSQGIVQLDRLVIPPATLKATMLSNRAACYLKQAKLLECQEDCTKALELLEQEKNDVSNVRSKLLYRRAKSLFLQANMPHKKQEDDLHNAAKDLLTLLSFDVGNKDATQLLNTIRAQHATESKQNNTSNTPMAKTLRDVQKLDDKLQHNLKIVLGLLTNDSVSASMELGRLGGVSLLLDIATTGDQKTTSTTTSSGDDEDNLKARKVALQCLSCAGSHPPFCRSFMKDGEIQDRISTLISDVVGVDGDAKADIAVSALTVFLRLILHLDRDDPDKEIAGTTLVNYPAVVKALLASFESGNLTVIRAAVDVLSTWTAGKNREMVIRASLENNLVDLPVPLTKYEQHQLKPKELSDYKQRVHKTKTRDEAWAFERSITFCLDGGLDALLSFSVSCDDAALRREITAVTGKLLAALADDNKMQEVAAPILGTPKETKKQETPEGESSGVIIEELDEDNDEEEGKVTDVTDDDDDDYPKPALSLTDKMKRGELATALLMANGDVGGWAIGSGWPDCSNDLTALVESNDVNALRVVAELLSSAASVKGTRPIVIKYLNDESMRQLVTHSDRGVRSAAASAVAKLGLSESHTQDFEIMGLLEAALYMLEEGEVVVQSASSENATAAVSSVPNTLGATTSVERGVEVITYLITKTIVKEEIASGLKATDQSTHTGLELLVKVADNLTAGDNVTAYGIASIFQLMAATPLTLRKEAFEGKEITMEQYDEIQKMQKTQEQKETEDTEPELKEDSDEQCMARVVKMTNGNVPRALIQLLKGASDKTLEQVIMALNRIANVQSVRGTMIQQGVLTALIKLEQDEINPSETRKKIIRNTRHCMAKLLVTTNPSLLTSAQSMGAIKPLIQLVRDVHSNDLQKFEALLSLTNIASMNDSTKNKIAAEKGVSSIKFAMFSDHPMVKKAATECLCNMVGNQKFMELLRDPEELRLWLALASDFEDSFECARAAAGCLAMATGDPEVAEALIKIKTFKERMDQCLESGSLEIIHRIMVVILNLVEHGDATKDAAVEHGLVAFVTAYADSYSDERKVEDLEFKDQDMAT